MTRGRKIILVVAIAMIGIIGWVVYGVLFQLAHVGEAYAAWDTGTLLVEYMKSNDNRWPSSWEELLSVLNSEAGEKIPLRGAQAGDLQYARSLRDKITVDWDFDPARPDGQRPVTRPDGGAFPMVWEDPNEMLQRYLHDRAETRPTPAR